MRRGPKSPAPPRSPPQVDHHAVADRGRSRGHRPHRSRSAAPYFGHNFARQLAVERFTMSAASDARAHRLFEYRRSPRWRDIRRWRHDVARFGRRHDDIRRAAIRSAFCGDTTGSDRARS